MLGRSVSVRAQPLPASGSAGASQSLSQKALTTCVSAAGGLATGLETRIDVQRFRRRVSTAASTSSRYAFFATGLHRIVFGPGFREEGSLIPYSSTSEINRRHHALVR